MAFTKEQIIAAGHEDTEHAWRQERDRADRLARELKIAHDFLKHHDLWDRFVRHDPTNLEQS